MSLCKRLVPIHDGKTLLPPHAIVDIAEPDWKHEPLAVDERKQWAETIARPDLVERAMSGWARRGEYADEAFELDMLNQTQAGLVGKAKPATGTSHLSNGN